MRAQFFGLIVLSEFRLWFVRDASILYAFEIAEGPGPQCFLLEIERICTLGNRHDNGANTFLGLGYTVPLGDLYVTNG
jgi:hypothetical protein